MLLSSLIMVHTHTHINASLLAWTSSSSSAPQVTSGFKSKSMAAALPPSFLDPLFSISLMEDSELRQLVLEILHNIIDRHDNRAKLRGIRWELRRRSGAGFQDQTSHYLLVCCRIIPNVAALKIKREKISKQDVAFMKKVVGAADLCSASSDVLLMFL